ncbi:MAG TPA: endolytic transglycosylase MltG [Fimbriimonadaceae bacterium]|nr:endolytic transglycosylase MltG [Fimbriimonadaceae bacterium]
MKTAKRNVGYFLLGIFLAGGVAAYIFQLKLRPASPGTAFYIRIQAKEPLSTALHDLQERGVIQSASALGLYARVKKKESIVEAGTYSVAPGMTADEVLKALRTPVTVKVTIPEYYWLGETARRMEDDQVAKAEDFVALAAQPKLFAKEVTFPLPENSLEGYLFPDTYRMQPMVGAKAAISQLLETFDRKVWRGLGQPKNLRNVIIVASMVEREAKLDKDRPIIAGVIENRLAKGMPLQVDATVLYAQQRWHQPTRYDIKHTYSPYNTYLFKGLPPGPICSPGLKSIKAALNPAKTNYLYYVGMPDGRTLYAETEEEHRANIAKRRRALRRAVG